jgi:hypothetical protein
VLNKNLIDAAIAENVFLEAAFTPKGSYQRPFPSCHSEGFKAFTFVWLSMLVQSAPNYSATD